MLGAIYGDKAGSIYEFDQTKKVKEIETNELIKPNSFFSDDTILTIAIMDAIINKLDYEATLKKYILHYEDYKPKFSPYFKTSFSPGLIKWAHGSGINNSIGNGAMMRISPVGYLFNSEKEVISNAYLATIPSHNSRSAIKSATIVSLMIYYFKNHLSKEEVYKKLNLSVSYQPFKNFNSTGDETLGNILYAIYNSTSFEDAIKITLKMGGDTDTNACIVGSIAEALYGMSEREKEDALNNIPEDFMKILNKVYKF